MGIIIQYSPDRALGMAVLDWNWYLHPGSNHKAINWKTTAIGLLAQLVLALGVLKIDAIKVVLNLLGIVWQKILDFTKGRNYILLGDKTDGYFNFDLSSCFKCCPTIVFGFAFAPHPCCFILASYNLLSRDFAICLLNF